MLSLVESCNAFLLPKNSALQLFTFKVINRKSFCLEILSPISSPILCDVSGFWSGLRFPDDTSSPTKLHPALASDGNCVARIILAVRNVCGGKHCRKIVKL